MTQPDDVDGRHGGAGVYRAWCRARHAVASLDQVVDMILRDATGLGGLQCEVLDHLTSNRGRPLPVQDVARALSITRFAVARTMTELQARGLVSIDVSDDPRADLLLTVTDAGTAVIAAAVDAAELVLGAGPRRAELGGLADRFRAAQHAQSLPGRP